MKLLILSLFVSAAIGGPLLAGSSGECEGRTNVGVNTNTCLSAVYVTSSIANAECGTACPYSANVFMEIRQGCGGGTQTDSASGTLPCGMAVVKTFQYQGATVGWASFACRACD